MTRIYLIGYMGAGKTTLGAPLAKALGMSFIDLDIYIENRYHKSINELFSQLGEQEFRIIEHKMLEEVSIIENVVIATGGGTPCHFDNLAIMRNSGLTIYLEVSIEKLHKRLIVGKWKRPKLKNKSNDELLDFITNGLSERLSYYEQAEIIHSGDKLETSSGILNSVASLLIKIDELE